MATSEVAVYKRALEQAGSRSAIATVNDASRGAEVCRLWFGPVRDQVLRAAPWPDAKATARLALLAERDDTLQWQVGDPAPGWRFAYAIPEDLLSPRYIPSYERFDFALYNDGSNDQKAILTNVETALLTYTKQQTSVGLWDTQLEMAITFALAAHICMPLNGRRTRAKELAEQANALIIEARVNAANDANDQLDTVPDWLVARGYGGVYPQARFYYPFGPMISLQEAAAVA